MRLTTTLLHVVLVMVLKEILLKILSMVLVHDLYSAKPDALKCLLINRAADSYIVLCQSFQSSSV